MNQKKRQQYKVYFDFETSTSGKTHEPYLVRYETEDGDRK